MEEHENPVIHSPNEVLELKSVDEIVTYVSKTAEKIRQSTTMDESNKIFQESLICLSNFTHET